MNLQKTTHTQRLSAQTLRRGGMIVLCIVGGVLGAALFFRFLWTPILPFLLGGVVAMLLQKPLDRLDAMCKHKKQLRKVWAFVLVFGCTGLLLCLLIWGGNALIRECGTFFGWLGDNIGAIEASLTDLTEQLEDALASLPMMRDTDREGGILFSVLSSADDLLVTMIGKTVSSVTSKIPAFLTAIAGALPQILLFFGVFLIASVYLTMEYRSIGTFLKNTFPRKTSVVLRGLRSSLVSTILLFGRAYGILCFVTFCELYAGFRILGIDWAFGAAILGAVIDLLPVLGTGTLLLPWAALELIRGELFTGVGLIVLYSIVCVIRQLIEPKIVGKSIGLHPLAALFFMYVGMQLFGLAGLFLLPMAASVIWKYVMERRGICVSHYSP